MNTTASFFGRRRVLGLLWALLPSVSRSQDPAWPALKTPGTMLLFRHAIAPGTGDPAGFRLNDCSTQRNLSESGREQARRLGRALEQRGVVVTEVWHSQWCRTADTARLALASLGQAVLKPQPAFNSFFGDRDQEAAQTAAARQLLLGWKGRGTLVVVTHQINITALTGMMLQSGEGVVVVARGSSLHTLGRIKPAEAAENRD